MRITIMALGSRGDVLPYAVLGRALQDAGHEVLFTTFEGFRAMAEGLGLRLHPVKGDAETLLRAAGGVEMLERGVNPVQLMRGIFEVFGTIASDYVEAFSHDALMESDAILNQLPMSLFGYDLAEKLYIPHLNLAVIPLETTRAWPLSLFPQMSLGPFYNRLTYGLAWQMGWQPFRGIVNRYRAKIGLPPAPFGGHAGRMAAERMPVINGFSEQVVPRPPDWGEHIHITGYWLQHGADWTPPADLADFITSGPPPVFVGFGSMPVRDPERTTAIVLDAVRRAGQRCVLHSGWAGLNAADMGDDIFLIQYAPYEWLFPRMAAVVIHGGSGTTGWGVWAGVPVIVVPFAADQPYWASRLVALGVSPPPVPFARLDAEALAYALRIAATHEPLRQRAAALGEKVRAEDGLGNAVRIIEGYLESGKA